MSNALLRLLSFRWSCLMLYTAGKMVSPLYYTLSHNVSNTHTNSVITTPPTPFETPSCWSEASTRNRIPYPSATRHGYSASRPQKGTSVWMNPIRGHPHPMRATSQASASSHSGSTGHHGGTMWLTGPAIAAASTPWRRIWPPSGVLGGCTQMSSCE